MTNADKIRQMSDEEMANIFAVSRCPENSKCWLYKKCADCWLCWLKQEVEE